jgi:hypothetical protein
MVLWMTVQKFSWCGEHDAFGVMFSTPTTKSGPSSRGTFRKFAAKIYTDLSLTFNDEICLTKFTAECNLWLSTFVQ